MSANKERCPLCESARSESFIEDRRRSYLRCETCALVFVSRRFLVSENEERERYDLHRNSPEDVGYRDFLKRIVGPLTVRHPGQADCLDFGCGPSPVLAEMLATEGFRVTTYDPLYFPDVKIEGSYDVITATEVFEHLRDPASEIENLASRLRPGGTLAVMTGIPGDKSDFANWHYITDKTHIRFYDWKTFEWIAKRFGWNAKRIDADIVFFENEK